MVGIYAKPALPGKTDNGYPQLVCQFHNNSVGLSEQLQVFHFGNLN